MKHFRNISNELEIPEQADIGAYFAWGVLFSPLVIGGIYFANDWIKIEKHYRELEKQKEIIERAKEQEIKRTADYNQLFDRVISQAITPAKKLTNK